MRNVSHTRQESPGFSRGEEVNIDIYEPCRCFAWVSMDGVVHMRWNSYPNASACFG